MEKWKSWKIYPTHIKQTICSFNDLIHKYSFFYFTSLRSSFFSANHLKFVPNVWNLAQTKLRDNVESHHTRVVNNKTELTIDNGGITIHCTQKLKTEELWIEDNYGWRRCAQGWELHSIQFVRQAYRKLFTFM